MILARNRQRARDNRHPLTYEEIRGAVRGYLNGKGKFEPGLYGVDPYAGSAGSRLRSQFRTTLPRKWSMSSWSGGGHSLVHLARMWQRTGPRSPGHRGRTRRTPAARTTTPRGAVTRLSLVRRGSTNARSALGSLCAFDTILPAFVTMRG